MGEDIAKYGGIFGATQGLLDQFGSERVIGYAHLRDGVHRRGDRRGG